MKELITFFLCMCVLTAFSSLCVCVYRWVYFCQLYNFQFDDDPLWAIQKRIIAMLYICDGLCLHGIVIVVFVVVIVVFFVWLLSLFFLFVWNRFCYVMLCCAQVLVFLSLSSIYYNSRHVCVCIFKMHKSPHSFDAYWLAFMCVVCFFFQRILKSSHEVVTSTHMQWYVIGMVHIV